jgi:D-beta-D-heptose 7-phosphate kinase / D-beta-D-heptose 1-phosphate adenosyltransferase
VVGRDMVEAAGGDVILVDLVPGQSTTAIVERARPGEGVTGKHHQISH